MTVLHNNGGAPVPQSTRRPYGSYKYPIEARAVRAADLVDNGCSVKDAAASLCVSPTYIRLVRHLGADGLFRLDCGELKLAQVARNYRQRLAEQRAQREQAKLAAEPNHGKHFAASNPPSLSDDVVENFVREIGVDRIWRVVDRLTQPELPLVAAE